MPPNRAANIRQRCRQIDGNLKRAQQFAASIYVTVEAQHPELGAELLEYVQWLDDLRYHYLLLYRKHWGGTERGLWKPEDQARILESAPEVPRGIYDR
jgi:hypothetical protein